MYESCIRFSVFKPPNVVAHNGLKLQTPSYIIHHDSGVVTHSLNAEAYSRLAYGITGGK